MHTATASHKAFVFLALAPWRVSCCALLALAIATGCQTKTSSSNSSSPPPPPPPPAVAEESVPAGPAWFNDVTADSGLDFTYRNGEEADHFAILESLGGGIGLIDYDADGLLDVFVAGGGYYDGDDKRQIRGYPCRLYKNLGNWQFSDVSADVGFSGVEWWYTHGVAVADYDRDGWPDLAVSGYGKLALFHNEPGESGPNRASRRW